MLVLYKNVRFVLFMKTSIQFHYWSLVEHDYNYDKWPGRICQIWQIQIGVF